MLILTWPIGLFESNTYLIANESTGESVVIDPGGDTTPLLTEVKRRNLTLRYILNTHGHIDHIAANAYLIPSTCNQLGLHPADRELLEAGGGAGWFDLAYVPSPPPNLELFDGQLLEFGNLKIEVIHTPGHTPGSVCFYIESAAALFTGDTLFAGSVGRTDFAGGSSRALSASLKRLIALPPTTKIYSGHGPTSTIEAEKLHNPWLQRLP